MIITRTIGLRIGLLLLAGVILQTSFFSLLSILGATPDVLLVIVASLGLLGGAVIGSVCGFAAGLLADSLVGATLGVASLSLLTAGYFAGRYREVFDLGGPLPLPAIIGGAAFGGAAVFSAIQLTLGVEVPVSLLVVREVILKGLLAALLAVPAHALIRRLLRPALVEDEPLAGGGAKDRAEARAAERMEASA